MAATSDNYTIVTSGITYTIASDYVKPSGGETAHFQLVKVAFGPDNTANYVSGTNPLPVGLCGAWGRYEYLAPSGYYSLASTIVGFTGSAVLVEGTDSGKVGITVGSLEVYGTDIDVRNLYGGSVGSALGITAGGITIDFVAVQGLCGGYPVGVTFSGTLPVSVAAFSDLGVFGVSGATAIGVTFGTVNIRGLTAASDTITVYGGGTASTVSVGLFGFTGTSTEALYSENNALNVNIKSSAGITIEALNLDIRNLDYTTDTVTVVGQGAVDDAARSTVPTYINALISDGSLDRIGGVTGAGWCGAALNAYLVNSGITFTVNANATFSSNVGITATYAGAIPVQGSNQASYGVWVTGSTSGGPITIQGACSGGNLSVVVTDFTTQTNTINTSVGQVKSNTDFLPALKKALYADTVSASFTDYPDGSSIYTLIRDGVVANTQSVKNSVIPNGNPHTTQSSLAVSVIGFKQQPAFMSRTGLATNSPQNLTAFSAAAGYTCANGVRIKASRIATGANASQNEIMCVISEADAAVYGASAGTASYVLYHGDEMFFEVDNINKIKVFYPSYSASFAPHNTGTSMTFSFYAS